MILIFSGALVIAGLFTLVPGRIMHAVVFGPKACPEKLFAPAVFGRFGNRGPAEPVPRPVSMAAAKRGPGPRKSLEKRREKPARTSLGVV